MRHFTRRSVLAGAAAATAFAPMAAIRSARAQMPCPTRSVKEFLAFAEKQALQRSDRAKIINQAVELLNGFYAHLPMKRALYGVDPLRRLELLRHRLPGMNSDAAFHAEMMAIFGSLHDIHTVYKPPLPYATAHAWLPFKVEACVDGGQRRYIVSRVVDWSVHPTFGPGVEILSWNGVPIERAAERIGTSGSTPAARRALGLARLTYRSLLWEPPPQEDSVLVHYRDGKQEMQITIPWQISSHPDFDGPCGEQGAVCTEVGELQKFRKFLYAPYWHCDWFGPTELVTTPDGDFGYIRIFSFERKDSTSDDRFVKEFRAKVDRFAGKTKGLIVDVRDNGGGSTRAGERIVQWVAPSPGTIEPARLYFVATPATLEFCQLGAPVDGLGPKGLAPWVPSIKQALQDGATFSEGFEYTARDRMHEPGRVIFPSPVIVITNALTYSSAEFFAAGFQDHGGMILGTDETTGGGGAGVRDDVTLRQYFLDAMKTTPLQQLPNGAGFMVAFRRSVRVGTGAGQEVEDTGVRCNRSYAMTRNDLLFNNRDLKREAARLLAQMPGP